MKRRILRSGSPRSRPRNVAQWRSMLLIVVLLTALGAGGCARIVPRSASRQIAHTPHVASAASPLAVIVNDELEQGHYATGAKALRGYLARHPGDQSAQRMLHQLTVDPEQMLGHASRPYVVQAGDSFSALAARYLGDANLFLILARYNGSTHPSQLAAGETIRLPTSFPSKRASPPEPAAATVAAKAARLQAQSVALFDQGHKAEALTALDQALDLDPGLPSDGAKSAALRRQLLANYHRRAVILYRDQHLDQAIALWNHVLTIDPGYEPAEIYRARALELKQRLNQLKTH